MKYEIYVQGKLYKTVEDSTSSNSMALLNEVTKDKDAGIIPGFDNTKPANISIVRIK